MMFVKIILFFLILAPFYILLGCGKPRRDPCSYCFASDEQEMCRPRCDAYQRYKAFMAEPGRVGHGATVGGHPPSGP